jgi:hypothetical protein
MQAEKIGLTRFFLWIDAAATGGTSGVRFRPKADIASEAVTGQSARMKMLRLIGLMMALFLPGTAARAALAQRSAQIGDTYEIRRIQDSLSQGSNASSGTSHDQDTIIERIEAVRPDGLELVFDLPKGATADERRQSWQFPARVFEPHEGPFKLLNAPELEGRLDAWLKWGKMSREACGHWIFTWNAFKIECDPQSVIETIQAFHPRLDDLRAGALYRDADALAPAPLTKKEAGAQGSSFTALLAIDPKVVQRDRAQADVVVGEIMRKPVSLDTALAKRAKEAVSGTIEVTINVDGGGQMRRLTKVTRSQTKNADGGLQTDVVTETIDRHLVSSTRP